MIEELKKFKTQPNDWVVREVKINISSEDFLTGKWWGCTNQKPILCLHGWQDNAGSFDRLIPLLPRQFSFLAIDIFGHGRSSWLPKGVNYYVFEFVHIILLVMREYNWDKVSLLGHSMGAMVAFLFTSLFPEKVDLLIKIDSFKNLDRTFEEEMMDTRQCILNSFIIDERIRSNTEPPSYDITEMIEKVYTGSFYNITKESAPYLLERSITRSSKFPNKFYFSRDPRLRNILLITNSEDKTIESAKRIENIPFLFFTTKDSSPLYAKMDFFDRIIGAFKKNPNFQLEIVDSDSHYFHLNNPEIISKALSEFLIKHKGILHHL